MRKIFFSDSGTLRSGWRVAVFLSLFVFTTALLGSIALSLASAMQIDVSPGSGRFLFINAAVSLLPAIGVGYFCGKYLENLPFRALGLSFTRGWLRHLLFGCLIGLLTLSTAVLIAFVLGGLRFELNAGAEPVTIVRSMAVSLVIFAAAAAFEEVLFRGYILQTLARSGYAWLAIALTSVLFGAVHLGNPNADAISTTNTVLAGLWFSIAYLRTRDLWFVTTLHLMWNWAQGSIFGIEVSGLTSISYAPLLIEHDSGPAWLTGSEYGIEAGIACTLALIASAALIWRLKALEPDPEMLGLTSADAHRGSNA